MSMSQMSLKRRHNILPVTIKCYQCGKTFSKSPSLIREHNFCSKECRLKWLGRHDIEIINKPGHSKGHKNPKLSRYNRDENRMNTKEGWTLKEKEHDRTRLLSNPLFPDQGKSYHKYYGKHLHRVVAEQGLGRKLKRNEVVHHLDGNKLNNDPDNLIVMTRQEHSRLHGKLNHDKLSM